MAEEIRLDRMVLALEPCCRPVPMGAPTRSWQPCHAAPCQCGKKPEPPLVPLSCAAAAAIFGNQLQVHQASPSSGFHSFPSKPFLPKARKFLRGWVVTCSKCRCSYQSVGGKAPHLGGRGGICPCFNQALPLGNYNSRWSAGLPAPSDGTLPECRLLQRLEAAPAS